MPYGSCTCDKFHAKVCKFFPGCNNKKCTFLLLLRKIDNDNGINIDMYAMNLYPS